MIKLQIQLDEKAFRVLQGLAKQEYRDPRFQATLLIQESLERRGLLIPQEGSQGKDRTVEAENGG